MPINVLGSNAGVFSNNFDTSSFVRKPFLRPNYIEKINKGDTVSKKQIWSKNLPNPISIGEAALKIYIEKMFNNPSMIKKIRTCWSLKNLDNFRFVNVNSFLSVYNHLTPKYYVDEAFINSVEESWLLRFDGG